MREITWNESLTSDNDFLKNILLRHESFKMIAVPTGKQRVVSDFIGAKITCLGMKYRAHVQGSDVTKFATACVGSVVLLLFGQHHAAGHLIKEASKDDDVLLDYEIVLAFANDDVIVKYLKNR